MTQEQFRPTLLDVPISFFEYDHKREHFANVPAEQTTLRRISCTTFYRLAIEAIRNEPHKAKQDELKKQLPAITPVALLFHRRRDTRFAQKIRQQWPLLMGDIDQKDNPAIDMAQLKRHLARLPYVLLCGYSVRGGLWFIVRLPDNQTPDTLAAHARYLQKLFSEKFRVKLDTSKGSNPTDLRFVSYDPAPYVNEAATILSGTYTPPKPKPPLFKRSSDTDIDQYRVEVCIEEVSRRGLYLGDSYADWYKVGCSLANTFGENGRNYFHQISQHYPKYKPVETDKQFTACLRVDSKVTLGTFFHLCEQQGIKWKDIILVERPKRQNNTWLMNGQLIYGDVLPVDPVDSYPAEWDEPNPPNAIPIIRLLP